MQGFQNRIVNLPEYYNFRCDLAKSDLERGGFVHTWWRMYARERHWAPPYYPALKEALNPARNPHLKRLSPRLVCLRGVPEGARQKALSGDLFANLGTGIAVETILACALLVFDPRRGDGNAYLALLHCENTPSAMDGLLEFAAEELTPCGARRVIGPVGISPWIESGVLANRWNQTPPVYAVYNPPFLPELMEKLMKPGPLLRMVRLPVPATSERTLPGPATLEVLDSTRLAGDLLPLFATACQEARETPPPDAFEADFLLKWLEPWPQWGWLATLGGQPVGFILLQPDVSTLLQRTHGGRTLWQRLDLRLRNPRSLHSGRVVFAGVAPAYRRQGIASQLWRQAVQFARTQSWETLSAGPFLEDSPATFFCTKLGGILEQEYRLYSHAL
jgi:GNAT superfamily N-acetyltransferase